MSVSLLLWQPRVMLPESSTNGDLPEGEWSPPGGATNPSAQVFSTELAQASRAADPTPVKEQFPSAAAVDATFGSQLLDAVRDQLPTISAIDWSFATWESPAANALNRALGCATRPRPSQPCSPKIPSANCAHGQLEFGDRSGDIGIHFASR